MRLPRKRETYCPPSPRAPPLPELSSCLGFASRQPLPSPLPTHSEREHAFRVVRVRRLVGPHEVVPLVLVREVGAVHEQFGVLVELVCQRRVEVFLRLLIHFHPDDSAHAIRHGARRAVVVRETSLESLALVPQNEIARLG